MSRHSAVLTRRVKCLHAVVVHLQRRVRPRPHEPHQMIGIVVDVHVGLADRMVVGPHVVNDHDVPVYLSPGNKNKYKKEKKNQIPIENRFVSTDRLAYIIIVTRTIRIHRSSIIRISGFRDSTFIGNPDLFLNPVFGFRNSDFTYFHSFPIKLLLLSSSYGQ